MVVQMASEVQEPLGPEPAYEYDGALHGRLVEAEGESTGVDELRADRDHAAQSGATEPEPPASGVQISQIDAAVYHGALGCDEGFPFRCAEDGS
jgi:hypothetical protein